jgi:RHS repeat-associated protein
MTGRSCNRSGGFFVIRPVARRRRRGYSRIRGTNLPTHGRPTAFGIVTRPTAPPPRSPAPPRAEVSSLGVVTASFRYRAYGQVSQFFGAPTPSWLGYAGQLLDPSGLYYMRARWYDPATGRFLTRDPAVVEVARPNSLNAFQYASENPLRRMDPTGLASELVEQGGACMDSQCTKQIAFSGETTFAAADTKTMWVLEEIEYADKSRALPDYYVEGGAYVAALSITRDAYNQHYVSPGVGTPGVSIMTGQLLSLEKPTQEQVASFISGPTVTVGLGFILAGAITFSPLANGPKFAIESGGSSPGPILNGAWGFLINK